LLLDEQFDYVISDELRRRGVDAVAVTKDRPDLVGQDDEVIEAFGLRGELHYGMLFTDDDTFPRGEAI
jgi:hypothetical protein